MKEWIVFKQKDATVMVVASYPTEQEALDYIHNNPQEDAVLYVQETQ